MIKNLIYENKEKKIEVFDVKDSMVRVLSVDGHAQGVSNMHDPSMPVSQYMWEMIDGVYRIPRGAKTALAIGGGACLIPTHLAKCFGIISTVLDTEPEMASISARYFGRADEVEFLVEEGKYWFTTFGFMTTYDMIFLDAFVGINQDQWLYSVEGYKAIAEALEPDGIFAMNTIELQLARGHHRKELEQVFEVISNEQIFANNAVPMGNSVYLCKKKEK